MAAVNGNAPAITLDPDQVSEIRHALLIGLACHGEIERLTNLHECLALTSDPAPAEFKPTNPSASPETIADFASALLYLEYGNG